MQPKSHNNHTPGIAPSIAQGAVLFALVVACIWAWQFFSLRFSQHQPQVAKRCAVWVAVEDNGARYVDCALWPPLGALTCAQEARHGDLLVMKKSPEEGRACELRSGGMNNRERAFLGLPMDINTCTNEELRVIPGLGLRRAAAIMELRHELGEFTSLDQLLDVHGIGPKMMERLAGHLYVNAGSAAQEM